MPKILLAGSDFRLLGTRAAVLGRTGASVVCCSAAEAFGIISTEKFDLVVLCHTLSDEDADRISCEIHGRWPETRILQVLSDLWKDPLHSRGHVVSNSSAEPSRLVRYITNLLQSLPNHRLEEASRRTLISTSPDIRAS